jgi:hypothetical protein
VNENGQVLGASVALGQGPTTPCPLFLDEITMAKRRNLKKEKALRNEAYARKFRKRTSKGRFGQRRTPQDSRSTDAEEGAETTAAADT